MDRKLKHKLKRFSSKSLNQISFTKNKFSRPSLIVFVVIFAGIGGYTFLRSFAAGSTTYYVSPSGSDLNSGTSSASPWKTVQKVGSTCFNPGDTILFQGGQTFSDAYLGMTCSGNSANPITVSSYGSGRAIFTEGVWLAGGLHDLVFNNLELTSANSGIFSSCGTCSANPTFNITLLNSYLHDSPDNGVQTNPNDHDWLIQGNTIRHTGDNGLGIYFSTNITVTHNTVTDTGWNSAITFGKHGIYAESPNMTISYNDFSNDTGGQAISARAHNQLIYGNLIHDTTDAINFFDFDNSPPPQGTSYVYYNKIWNISNNVFYYDNGLDPQGNIPSVNFVIANNTVDLSNGSQAFNLSKVPSIDNITTVNNIFTGSYNSAYQGCATCSEHNNDWFGASTNIPSGSNDLFINPNISAAPSFSLPVGSALVDKGTATVSGLTYVKSSDGQPLHYTCNAPDIGAVEFGSSGTAVTGDLNCDGRVNSFDLSIFLSHWLQSGVGLPEDFNNDNVVNSFDLSILLSYFGT